MPMEAQRRRGGILPTHSQPDTRKRWVVITTLRPLYPRERPGTHCTGVWVGLGAGLNSTENLAPTVIRSPNRPDRSESLYRLSYRGRQGLRQNIFTFHNVSHTLQNLRIFKISFVKTDINICGHAGRFSSGYFKQNSYRTA